LSFVPDKIFNKISEISACTLKNEGIKGLVLDIDNTMAPKSVALPDDLLIKWISEIRETGTKLFVISNNNHGRVSKFAQALDLPFIYSGMKPFPFSFKKAVIAMGLDPKEVAAVGDQIFTDVWGAHAAGLSAWLVMPVESKETLLFKIRRQFERPFINKFHKLDKKAGG
jgi:HAD superfamily phosphatase (TIGR01668 family)